MCRDEAGTGCGCLIELEGYRLARHGDDMIHSEVRALYSYWERLRVGRPCPERTEVDPRDIGGEQRHLFVLEDLGRGNFRFRLAGSGLLAAFGFDLRGMSARAIMEGRSRESFVALIAETLAEPGVGYARLLASDGMAVWEVVLLPLRGRFGAIDRLIGCLHPLSGRDPAPGPVPLRFTIQSMAIQPVLPADAAAATGGRELAAGFAEGPASFELARHRGLRAIEGGGQQHERAGGKAPKLKVVRDKE